MMTVNRVALALSAVLLISGCAEVEFVSTILKSGKGTSGGHYKVGRPYQINGTWYYPAEEPFYDEKGIASWYGEPFHGELTANGEIYDMHELTAAHKTLPMPVYVRVTNLDNGTSLVLRVNDRGPFIAGRIIDVSRRAAQLLDFEARGTVRVRVQVIDPDSKKTWAELGREPSGGAPPLPPSIDFTSEDPGGGLFVQAGAFTDAARAYVVSNSLVGTGDIHVVRTVVDNRVFYRVRVGPFVARNQANTVLERVVELGYREAIVVTVL